MPFNFAQYNQDNPYRSGQSPYSYGRNFFAAAGNPFSQYNTQTEQNPSINLPDPTQYFDPTNINNLYNTLLGNLGRAQGGAVAGAQRTAAAQAGAGGALNPGAYIAGAGSQARAPFAQVFGGAETSRAQALQANQGMLLEALMKKGSLEEQSRQFNVGDERSRQQLEQQWKMFLQQMQLQRDQSEAGAFDWISAILPALAAPFTGGTSLLGYLTQGGNPVFGGGSSGNPYGFYGGGR